MNSQAEMPAESAASEPRIAIVTNHLLRAKNSAESTWIKSTSVPAKFISTLRDLLDLPDGVRVLVLDYRTGKGPGDICETARLMINRGNFERFEI
jgi:hypothetical protein